MAVGTGLRRDVAREFLAHAGGVGFVITALEVVDDPFERHCFCHGAAALIAEGDLDGLAPGAVENNLPGLCRHFVPGRLEVEVVYPGHGLEDLVVVAAAPVPATDRTTCDTDLLVGDDLGRVEELLDAESVACGAGPDRIVEREEPRFQLLDAVTALRAGEICREKHLGVLAIHVGDTRHTMGKVQRCLEGFGKTLLQVTAHLETVNDDLDRVFPVKLQLGRIIELDDLAVDTCTQKTLCMQFSKQLVVFALALADDGSKQHHARTFRKRKDLVDHLAHGLCLESIAMHGAVWRTGPRKQQPQVIVDFGDGADRRARVVARGLLLDGDCRRKPFDVVDIRLFHHREELPRIGRQRLDVAPLTLGIDGIEGKRGFAGSGKTGDDNQLVARQLQRNILEVVGARPADRNGVHVRFSVKKSGESGTIRPFELQRQKHQRPARKPPPGSSRDPLQSLNTA